MIQQRSTVTQVLWDTKTKRYTRREVRQFAKVHLYGKSLAFNAPPKRSRWGKLVDSVFRKRAA